MGKEELFKGLDFYFDSNDYLFKVMKNDEEIFIERISFLRNLYKIAKEDNITNYKISYNDLKQYFKELSPRFGTRCSVHKDGLNTVVKNVNIH